jgi:hypothetical protein
MSEVKNNPCGMTNCSHENRFFIVVDDTEECIRQEKCSGPLQGIPIQQVFIDLSDCKPQARKYDVRKENEECKPIDEKNTSHYVKK